MSSPIGKMMMVLGAVIFLVGLGFVFADRLPFLKSLGRLPGDFSWKGDNWQVHMPIATSLLISVLLSGALWLFSRLSGRG
jgi:hypothetical protein